MGRKKRPFYRIVAIDSKKRRDGLEIERLGWYNPLPGDLTCEIKEDRVLYWMKNGAITSDSVKGIFRRQGLSYKWYLMEQGFKGLELDKLLEEDGISLIHTIGSVNPPRDPHPWITKYIFPGGYTPSLSEVTTPIERAGLIVADIEVLRLHYSHTLRHWKENCIKNKEKIIEMFDEKFFRMWEFYLTGCEMAFKWGDQVVYQFQLTKNYTSTPITRDYIYQ